MGLVTVELLNVRVEYQNCLELSNVFVSLSLVESSTPNQYLPVFTIAIQVREYMIYEYPLWRGAELIGEGTS